MLDSEGQVFVNIVGQHVQLVLLGHILVSQLSRGCCEHLMSSFVHCQVALLVADSVKEFVQIIALLLSGLQLLLKVGLLGSEMLVCSTQLSDRDAHRLN